LSGELKVFQTSILEGNGGAGPPITRNNSKEDLKGDYHIVRPKFLKEGHSRKGSSGLSTPGGLGKNYEQESSILSEGFRHNIREGAFFNGSKIQGKGSRKLSLPLEVIGISEGRGKNEREEEDVSGSRGTERSAVTFVKGQLSAKIGKRIMRLQENITLIEDGMFEGVRKG